MSFCSFTKDFAQNSITNVQNSFITEYLTDASGEAVKVYLYGLFLCQNFAEEFNLTDFSKSLYMEESIVRDCFKFWEEYGLVSVISEEPFTVKYLSLSKTSKPRKFKPEKYSEFNKAIQTYITERMISTSEYSEYFSIMEDYSISPEAMLMIIKYCVDLKGANIGYKYISTVARDFASRQITSVSAIEQELSEYINHTNDIQTVLSTLGVRRKPDIDDLKLFNKWRFELQFELKAITYCAKISKCKNMEKLDCLMLELFNNKRFSEKEIESYFKDKNAIRETAKAISNALSVYCEIITPYIDNYVSPWLNKGFSEDTLLLIANYCFKKKRKSFEEMDETVENLYSSGIVSLESFVQYVKTISADDEFIKNVLSLTGNDRRPTKWDRENLKHWREWGFTDEMILEASKLAVGKNNSISYMNVILSNWKAGNIFSQEDIKPIESNIANTPKQSFAPKFGTERTYSKEDYEAILTNIEDVDF